VNKLVEESGRNVAPITLDRHILQGFSRGESLGPAEFSAFKILGVVMNRVVMVLTIVSVVVGHVETALAFSARSVRHSDATWSKVNFVGNIPTEANPIVGEKRLATMRRAGKLPDTFLRGRCTYNLAGDTGAAYYVKTCR
jgi:hypothetical protein